MMRAQPPPGSALLVLVSPVRGFSANVKVDEEGGYGRELVAGGSVQFPLKPGNHTLSVSIPAFHPGERTLDFSIQEGRTIFLTLNPSGVGTSAPGPLNVTLMEVSREKAARIAMF